MQSLLDATKFEWHQISNVTAKGNGATSSVEIEMISRKGEDSAYAKRIGGGTTAEAWYVDDVYYVKNKNGQVKYEDVTFAQFCTDQIAMFDEEDVFELSDIQFTGVLFQPDEDNYVLRLPVSETEGKMLCTQMGYADAENVEYTLVLTYNAEGELLLHTYELSFTTVSQGVSVEVDVLLDTQIVALNKNITVSAPEQAASYVTTVYPTEEE